MNRLFLAALCVAAALHANAAQFAFGAFGDVPYNASEEAQFPELIAEMNHQKLALVIHVGDFKSAQMDCSDELFLQRREWFGLSHHPFIYIPGDNEWLDCRRAYGARRDPLERLEKLRELFFARDSALGQRSLAVTRQVKRGYPEHLRWVYEGVIFATLNIPGPDNNAGTPQESRPRTDAALAWLREAFATASERKLPAIVIGTQANLFSGNPAYAPFIAALADEAQRFRGEVLVIHGDTHVYHFDKALVDPRSGSKVANVTRIEVPGSPFVNWVYVTVTIDNGRARIDAKPGSELLPR